MRRVLALVLIATALGTLADTRYHNPIRMVNLSRAVSTPSYKSCIASVWNLDDNAASTTVDDSGPENRDGTAAANTSTKSVPGILGTALDFNGTSDGILIGDFYRFNPGTNFSISYWVWSKMATKLGNPIGKDNNTSRGWIHQLAATNYAAAAGSFYNVVAGENSILLSTPHIPTQRWTFCVFTYRQDSTRATTFWTNAVLKNTGSPAGAMPNCSANLYIGRVAYPAFEGWFTGRLDQVVIWTNKILTALEITNLYNNGNGVALP
jgi:hypothetical protein